MSGCCTLPAALPASDKLALLYGTWNINICPCGPFSTTSCKTSLPPKVGDWNGWYGSLLTGSPTKSPILFDLDITCEISGTGFEWAVKVTNDNECGTGGAQLSGSCDSCAGGPGSAWAPIGGDCCGGQPGDAPGMWVQIFNVEPPTPPHVPFPPPRTPPCVSPCGCPV